MREWRRRIYPVDQTFTAVNGTHNICSSFPLARLWFFPHIDVTLVSASTILAQGHTTVRKFVSDILTSRVLVRRSFFASKTCTSTLPQEKVSKRIPLPSVKRPLSRCKVNHSILRPSTNLQYIAQRKRVQHPLKHGTARHGTNLVTKPKETT